MAAAGPWGSVESPRPGESLRPAATVAPATEESSVHGPARGRIARRPAAVPRRDPVPWTGTINPFAADALIQGFVIWVRHTFQAASLPIATASVEYVRRVERRDDGLLVVADAGLWRDGQRIHEIRNVGLTVLEAGS